MPVETTFADLYHTEYVRFCRENMMDGLILIALRSLQIPALHNLQKEDIYSFGVHCPDACVTGNFHALALCALVLCYHNAWASLLARAIISWEIQL